MPAQQPYRSKLLWRIIQIKSKLGQWLVAFDNNMAKQKPENVKLDFAKSKLLKANLWWIAKENDSWFFLYGLMGPEPQKRNYCF